MIASAKLSRTAIFGNKQCHIQASAWHDTDTPKGYKMKTIQDMQDLGRAIRDRRRALGYTQAFLADYAGISASFLSELENGKETIQAGKMMEVISLLGMDICIRNRGE